MKTEEEKKKREWRHRLVGLIAGIVTFILCTWFFQTTDVFGAAPFKDVTSGNWYSKFVTQLSEENIISGYPDGTFRPGNTVTCGQFLSMALQMADRTGALEPYEEVALAEEQHWARSFYDRALAQEVLFEDELPQTSLNHPISREWMAVICSRLLPEFQTSAAQYENALAAISDVEELSAHSYEIVTSYTSGLLSGYTDGTFRPEGSLTRAEAATVIYKLRELWESDGATDTGLSVPDESQEETSREDEPADAAPEPDVSEPVSWEKNPADFPEGTVGFYYDLTVAGSDDEAVETMKQHMSKQITAVEFEEPETMAEQVFQSFRGFAQRVAARMEEGNQGLRKEYVCGHPVLMEAVGGQIRVYVKPKGTETEYWEVTPGEVSEEFF